MCMLLLACDSGDIITPAADHDAEGLTVRLEGQWTGVLQWADGYNLCLAAYAEGDEYSMVQKQITHDAPQGDTILLAGIRDDAATVELCITDALRHRVLTLHSTPLDGSNHDGDTLVITLPGVQDVGMYASIQAAVFDGSAYSCSRCHGGGQPRAGLDLTAGSSRQSLVGTASTCVPGGVRVMPAQADSSVLLQALLPDNPAHLRFDHSNLVPPSIRRLIADWINSLQNK